MVLCAVCGVMYIEDICGDLWSRLVRVDKECTVNSSESSLYKLYHRCSHHTEDGHNNCRNMLVIFYVWVSVHHKLIYIKRTNVMQLGSMFICNCNIALHVSDAFCIHLQEHLETAEASSGEWHNDLVWMPSTLDALLDTSTRLMSLTRGCFCSF